MKRIKYILLVGSLGLLTSCVSDLLDQNATTQMSSEIFWRTPQDAVDATTGVYEATRTLFGRDYYFDGQGEFQYTRGTSLGSGTWNPSSGAGSGFDYMWNNAYTVINRANYVLANTESMLNKETLEDNKIILNRIKGENRFLRALAYFRLLELWGDVPYFAHVLSGNDEATSQARTPAETVKDNIIEDLTFAISVLPVPKSTQQGRASLAAAYGFRAKIQLYWASWKKNGWPELSGFTQNQGEAQKYYQQAADDFHKVIYDYGLALFSEGNPGTYDSPSYWDLFNYVNENSPEIIFAVQYGGPGLSQGEELLRDFGTRNTGNAQCWVTPTTRLIDRYQKISTGDFAQPIVLINDVKYPNGSVNRTTYEDRDWRMKATLLWDGESMLTMSTDGMTLLGRMPFKYGSKDGINFINYDVGTSTGYLFRKWVRQTAIADRSDGPQDFYLMRLADVYLMYCEAVNEVSGPSSELVGLINKIRKRGNLPALANQKSANKDEFFKAIEQERIIELIAEGHRPFDIRRWRKVEEIWGAPGGPGIVMYNTHNVSVRDEFKNIAAREYERFYINRIPLKEIERNSKLIQNKPWL